MYANRQYTSIMVDSLGHRNLIREIISYLVGVKIFPWRSVQLQDLSLHSGWEHSRIVVNEIKIVALGSDLN